MNSKQAKSGRIIGTEVISGTRWNALRASRMPAMLAAVLIAGCLSRHPPPIDRAAMPPNTVALSQVMRELSSRPGFTEAFLAQVQGKQRNAGAAFLTPALVDRLREMILGKDWQGLDHFPGWTMREINPTVRFVGHIAGKDSAVDAMATAGGAPNVGTSARNIVERFVDLGEYGFHRDQRVSLDIPSKANGFEEREFVSVLADGVTRGDGANPTLASMHAESVRLAEVLNRLSLNGTEGAGAFSVALGQTIAQSPESLIVALARSGHTIEVADSRYFANFGHLHYKGQDVMMPFLVNTQIAVPTGLTERQRPLLVPVSHAEYEWFVRGPKINAAVSFYFGIDGKAEFRTMDQLDQAWVMNRHAHQYRGADAVEVTRLTGEMVKAYAHLHQTHPAIPFGGYYAFGVCQDVVAAIELKMTGKATLFPNTADASFFTDGRDAEINTLIRRLPKDRDGTAPEVERILGSLPVGSSDKELATVSIPGLGADLIAVHDAWTEGTLERTGSAWHRWLKWAFGAVGALLGLSIATSVMRPKKQ